MVAQWTCEILSKMHLYNITAKELSEKLGYNPCYVSMVMNGHRNPKQAKEKFSAALDELIQEKEVRA